MVQYVEQMAGKLCHVDKNEILMDFNPFFHKCSHQCSREYLSFRGSPVVFKRVRVAQSLVFCVWFCGSFLSFFIWPMYCLSFKLQLQNTPLVSSNFSQNTSEGWYIYHQGRFLWYHVFYDTVFSRAISINFRRHFFNLTTTVP